MISASEQALQNWARAATDEQLAAGPTMDDLGGIEFVLADADELCRGPQLPYFMHAVALDIDRLAAEQAELVLSAIRGGLEQPASGWVLSDAIDELWEYPALLDRLSKVVARALWNHADAALHSDTAPTLAHPALLGLLRLALADRANQHRVLTLLTEITGTEPVDALDRIPLIIGIAHDHFRDNNLPDVLTCLAGKADLPAPIRADAVFELALADLQDALYGHDRALVETHLRRSLMRFREVDQGNEARHDARAYAAAVEAVLVFADLDDNTDPDIVRARLTAATDQLEGSLSTLNAWNSRHHELPWLAARGQAIAAWARLVTALRTAETHLRQPSWYDAANALNQLLDVYLASRAVRIHPTNAEGVGALIFPAVESAFIRRAGLLHHLEHALTYDPRFSSHPDAIALRDAVHTRRTMLSSQGEAMPGKVLGQRPALAALFTDEAGGLREDLDSDLLDSVERLLQREYCGFTPTGNSTFDEQLNSVLERLAGSVKWNPPVSTEFTILLEQVFRFLCIRFDAQADLYGDRTAYLGPPPPKEDGTPKLWPEKAVQDDLHQHLSGTLTPGTVQREIIDISGGRTDVTYAPRPGNRFVVELKRRETPATQESIERDYLAQATNYTATGPPFGILIVADHGPHTAGYASFDDSVWVASVARSQTEVPRLIVVGVLPIGRPTPSALRASYSARDMQNTEAENARNLGRNL